MSLESQQAIDNLITKFYSAFDNRNGIPNYSILDDLFIENAVINTRIDEGIETLSFREFIQPRVIILTNGQLTDFFEIELKHQTHIGSGIATRLSEYEKSGCLNGDNFSGNGLKHFQLARIESEWKITSIIWEDSPRI